CSHMSSYDLPSFHLHDALLIYGERRGLARPVRADDAVEGARRHLKVDVVDGRCSAEVFRQALHREGDVDAERSRSGRFGRGRTKDRKSTRLNSSHVKISYAVFC